MAIVIKPATDDRFIQVTLNGRDVKVENLHQDTEFAVYTRNGRLVGSGKGRADLDRALRALGELEKEEQATALADLTEELVAFDFEGELLTRFEDQVLFVTAIENIEAVGSYSALEWENVELFKLRIQKDSLPSFGR